MPARCDLLVLDTAGLELAGRVAQRGLLLLDDDPAEAGRLAGRPAVSRYLDEAHRRRALVEAVLAVVDPVRLARFLQRLGEQLSILRARAAEERRALRDDEVRLSATEYRFVTAIEAVLDVAHLATPTTCGDAVAERTGDDGHAVHGRRPVNTPSPSRTSPWSPPTSPATATPCGRCSSSRWPMRPCGSTSSARDGSTRQRVCRCTG